MQTDHKQIPNYDMGYKQVCSITEEFLHFLQKYVHAEWVANLKLEHIVPYPNELYLPDYERRIPDLVFQILTEEKEILCYMIVQLQSTIDFSMIFRFASELYGTLMRSFLQNTKSERERKGFQIPAAVPIPLYNGEAKWSAVRNFHEYQIQNIYYKEHILDFEYYLVDISRLDDQEILTTNYLIDNIIYLDKHRYDLANLIEKLFFILERIRQLSPEKQAIFWEWTEHVLSASVNEKYKSKIKKIIHESKGEYRMFKYAITDVIEKAMAENYKNGQKAGISQGISQGKLSESVSIILQKLDQGLSSESIAYWLGKDYSFVHTIEQLHHTYPSATIDQIVTYYTQSSSNKKEDSTQIPTV